MRVYNMERKVQTMKFKEGDEAIIKSRTCSAPTGEYCNGCNIGDKVIIINPKFSSNKEIFVSFLGTDRQCSGFIESDLDHFFTTWKNRYKQ